MYELVSLISAFFNRTHLNASNYHVCCWSSCPPESGVSQTVVWVVADSQAFHKQKGNPRVYTILKTRYLKGHYLPTAVAFFQVGSLMVR
jgi:hypothetical protein